MSIPDNPFTSNNPVTSSPPVLQIDEIASEVTPLNPASTSSQPREAPRGSNSQTPGGSLLLPAAQGTKTPRRVQWTSDSHIVQVNQIPSSPVTTLDADNIDQVDAALERHRSNPPRRPLSSLSIASSGDGTADHSDEDYDYRLDVDPPANPLEPVGSQGSQTGRDDEVRGIHSILDTGINDHVGGEYIPLGETDGLPNITRSETADEMGAAKDLVRAHTGKWGVLRRRIKGAGNVTRSFGARGGAAAAANVDEEKATAEQEAFVARYPETGRGQGHSHNAMPALPGGASVLSSLLALYGQQSGMQSGNTSAASSRPTSDNEISDEEEEGRRRKRSSDMSRSRQPGWFMGRKSVSDTSNSTPPGDINVINDDHRPSELEDQLTHHRSKSTSSLVERPPPSPGLMGVIQKAKQQYKEKDRPKAARSGAGVFGALIQNTQNISGVATPAASTLAPAANRSGYHLSRYSLHEVDPEQINQPWRPTSRPGSHAGSRPASVHSSTAVSNNGDSSTTKDEYGSSMKKAVSTDDMLTMRSDQSAAGVGFGSGGRKRPRPNLTLESLGRLPTNMLKEGGHALKEGGHVIRNAEKWILSGGKTPLTTPPMEKFGTGDGFFPKMMTEDERRRKEWEAEKRRRKKAKEARKKQEIFIIQHVAAILARQQFLMKLARALMMFGSPTHRLETQIQATAKVLEINAQVVYFPGTMLISFGDEATHTSETKFLKQATGLDLGKLLATHYVYWNVVHDKMSVETASKDLDMLMTTPVYYAWWQTLVVGAFCSAFITVISFYGSFIDALMSMVLGMFLVGVQMLSARNDLFSNVFEIVIATIISFIAAALASTQYFCYTALVSGGVVLILPGYIVLSGALELASRNITAGAVRIGYSVIYSLFLGFGISIGAELYIKITGLQVVGASDYTCASTHDGKPWYMITPSQYWYFLCCPGFAFFLALRNQQPLFAKELPIMVLIAAAGWCSNHFSADAFPGRSDMTSAIGSFVVGTLGNLYGRVSNGSSFPVTVVGILFQLPSGLSNGGLFSFATESTSGSSSAYSDGFSVAEQLISVAIGLTVGLFVSAVVTHPFGGGRRRGSGIFSF